MARVFISYRRQVSAGHARALYDRLVQRFPGQIFMDVAGSIAPGVDFVDAIEEAIGSCKVLLVMIGRDWVSGGEQGNRLEDSNDFVRLEIAAALSRKVVVVPVLVEEARMPSSSDLPKDIAKLARIQAIELRDTRWDADVDMLIAELVRMTATPEAPPTEAPRAPSPNVVVAEHQAAETRSAQNQGRRRPLGAIALGLVALVAVFLVGYFWLGSRGNQVPNLVGLLVDRAQDRLQSAGLALGKITVQRTSQARSKEVLQQSPPAGTKVTRGMTVALVIAGGPVVPSVVGKDLDAARSELRAAGFDIRVKTEPTDRSRSRPNSVLHVTPAEGTEVSEKSPAVELVIAIAPIDVGLTVPSVIGKVSAEAIKQLREAGFDPRGRAGIRNSRLADLQVITQDPAAGGKLARGGVVAFEFNPAAEPNATPSLVRNVTILYPDNRQRPAEDLAQQFQGRGWQVTVKSGGDSARGGRVLYFVNSDVRTAEGIAGRATDWLERLGQRDRSFKAVFERPTPGTVAVDGGYFLIYTH